VFISALGRIPGSRGGRGLAALGLVIFAYGANAAVLPEDRADILFHSYSGDNVTIQGPSLLVRKEFAGKFSASANYYVDRVSSASIDVVTRASEYTEERIQHSVGLDYLHDRSIMSLGFTQSEENDYSAETFNIGISQDMFGDLTTVSLGYSVGNDEVGRRGDPNQVGEVQRQQYRIGLSQILTRNLILGLSFETITDEGFLNNPYRAVRFLDGTGGYQYANEVYPNTRSSDAGSIQLKYHLPYRAAVNVGYRQYADTWNISASQYEVGYTHPLNNGLTFEGSLRAYSQTKADFFSDLFPFANSQNFMARDKELSTFSSTTLRVGVSYDIVSSGWGFIDRGTINLTVDHIMFEYEDFRDLRVTGVAAGEEPLFSFDANVVQFFVSFWF